MARDVGVKVDESDKDDERNPKPRTCTGTIREQADHEREPE